MDYKFKIGDTVELISITDGFSVWADIGDFGIIVDYDRIPNVPPICYEVNFGNCEQSVQEVDLKLVTNEN